MAAERSYSEAQLSKFRRLIRVSVRWLFSGDLSERIQEQTVRQAFDQTSKRKRKQVSEANLAVILIDALSYHEGWVYEDKFAEKLGLAPKAVRRTLQFLQRQGFVAREHRAERKQGDKVESTVEYEDVVAASRTVSYVSIDYPHFYDMLRLRLHLAKKAASDKVDDGSAVEAYACCSRDGVAQTCGRKFDSFDLAMLHADADGLNACPTCDAGVIAPDDAESQKEPNGLARIRRQRLRREAASAQRAALFSALRPLESLIAELAAIDPPDFGSLTDWAQRRQELLASGQAQAAAGGRSGGGRRGHLDYGIDGPVNGMLSVDVDSGDGAAAAAAVGAAPAGGRVTADVEVAPDVRASLPYFIREAGARGPANSEAGGAAAADAGGAAPAVATGDAGDAEAAERAANYAAFCRQYEQQLAALRAQAAAQVEDDAVAAIKAEIKEEPVEASHDDVGAGAVAVADKAGVATAAAAAPVKMDADDAEVDMDWEDA